MQNEENQQQDAEQQEEQLSFSLLLKKIPVKLRDESGEKMYTLTEIDGRKRDQFLDGVNKRLKYQGGEAVGVENFQGLQASLVTLCLLDKEGVRVDAKTIQKYPATVISALFKKCKEMNNLKDEDSLKPKNV